MTIKQQGGIFGRNPTFNDLTVEGTLSTSGTISFPADSISGDAIDGGIATPATLNATDGTFSTLSATTSADLELLTVDILELNGATVGWTNSGSITTSLFTSGSKEQSLILRLDDNNASATGYFEVQEGSAGSKLLTVKEDNDVIFYKTDGTTAGMTYDASAFSLAFASGGGIDFSATSGTGTSELFDDYEEGEHTAVITATTSGTITLNSTNNKLAYTKVGRVVHVQGTIVVDSVSSPVGVAKITLPFTASNSLSGLAERSPPSIWIQGSVSKNTTDFIGYVAEGSNQISVGTGDSSNFLSLGANQLQASSSIYISVTYTAS